MMLRNRSSLFLAFSPNLAQSILSLVIVALCQTSGHAQSSWTTPARINPTGTLQQDYQVIAVGPQRQIAVACREGNISGRMAVYRSTDNGTTFLRTQIATPPVPEFEMRRTEALAFDVDGSLFLLWSWNELPLVGPSQWLVLSKSTDGGVSFSNIWSNAQLFVLNQHKMIITPDRTIHIVRDSLVRPIPPPPQNANKIIYTRLIHGNPANRIETVLPQPGDTVYTRDKVDLLIFGDKVHYAAVGRPNTTPYSKLYYSRSLDSGRTFMPMVVVDSCMPYFGLSSSARIVLFGAGGDTFPFPHGLLGARYVSDSSIAFSSLFLFGGKWLALDGTIRLSSSISHDYLVYGGVDTQSVTAYYQYDDLQLSPTDSAFFPLLKHPDFALDSLGGKYIVADHQHEFRLYFTKKDVIASTREESQLPSTTLLYQNYPNPFNPVTTIEYAVAPARNSTHELQTVRLCVYDILGRQVASLVDEPKQPGRYRSTWEAVGISSGVYFTRLELNDALVAVSKLLLIR